MWTSAAHGSAGSHARYASSRPCGTQNAVAVFAAAQFETGAVGFANATVAVESVISDGREIEELGVMVTRGLSVNWCQHGF